MLGSRTHGAGFADDPTPIAGAPVGSITRALQEIQNARRLPMAAWHGRVAA